MFKLTFMNIFIQLIQTHLDDRPRINACQQSEKNYSRLHTVQGILSSHDFLHRLAKKLAKNGKLGLR